MGGQLALLAFLALLTGCLAHCFMCGVWWRAQVVEAFDVLADEEQRAVYDKCRDYMVRGRQGPCHPPTPVWEPAHCVYQPDRTCDIGTAIDYTMLGVCLSPQEANPGKGLPVLSAEEAALMRSGIAELARLRRMGAKAAKHPPMEREVSCIRAGLRGCLERGRGGELRRCVAEFPDSC